MQGKHKMHKKTDFIIQAIDFREFCLTGNLLII